MRIALPYDDEVLYYHYAKAKQFIIYEIKRKKVIRSWVIDAYGQGKDIQMNLLQSRSVDVLICEKICPSAIEGLHQIGIDVIQGANGYTDEIVYDYLHELLVLDNQKCH